MEFLEPRARRIDGPSDATAIGMTLGSDIDVEKEHSSVLVVEDDSSLREVLCELLRDAGYSTKGAGSLGEAREVLAHEKPSMLMLDLELPDGSGTELLDELSTRVSAPPTMLLTGEIDGRSTARRWGVPIVTKPRIEDLLRAVAWTVDQRPKPHLTARRSSHA